MEEAGQTPGADHKRGFRIRLGVLALVVLVAGVVYFQFRDSISLVSLAEREAELRRVQHDHPLVLYASAFLIYVTVAGLSLPGATGLTLVYSWFFGFWRALLLVSFASTAGATVAFLLSRFILRDFVQRQFGQRLKVFNEALQREGAFYLFTSRLIPVFPFFVINLVAGLTPIRTRTFWWVSQLGMLPGTCVYVYVGSAVPDARRLAEEGWRAVLSPGQLAQLTVAFLLLGFFPLLVKKIVQRVKTAR